MQAIIIDTETTGTKDPALVEVAYAPLGIHTLDVIGQPQQHRVMLAGAVVDQRYNPGKPIELGAMATHGIIDADVKDCRLATDWRPPVVDYIVGHNIDFDAVAARFPATVKRICTLAMARALEPRVDNHKLTTLCYHFMPHAEARERVRGAHGAHADILMCLDVLNYMMPSTGATTFAELWEFSEAARIPRVMWFGKHINVPVEKVPMDYRFWYARQPDPDLYLLKAWKMR